MPAPLRSRTQSGWRAAPWRRVAAQFRVIRGRLNFSADNSDSVIVRSGSTAAGVRLVDSVNVAPASHHLPQKSIISSVPEPDSLAQADSNLAAADAFTGRYGRGRTRRAGRGRQGHQRRAGAGAISGVPRRYRDNP